MEAYMLFLVLTAIAGLVSVVLGYFAYYVEPVEHVLGRRLLIWGYALLLGCWAWPLFYIAVALKFGPTLLSKLVSPLRKKNIGRR